MFENFKKTAEPITKFNKLAMSAVAKVGEMQMETLRDSFNMASEQAKAATQIRDYEDFQKYLSGQQEVFSTMVEKASENMSELSRIADEFREEATQVFQAQENEDQDGKPAASAGSSSKSSSTGSRSQAAKAKTADKPTQ